MLVSLSRGYGVDDIDVEQFTERLVGLHGEVFLDTGLHVLEIHAACNLAVGIGVAHEYYIDAVSLRGLLVHGHFTFLGEVLRNVEIGLGNVRIVIRLHGLTVRFPYTVGGVQAVSPGRDVEGHLRVPRIIDGRTDGRQQAPEIDRFQFLAVIEGIVSHRDQAGGQGDAPQLMAVRECIHADSLHLVTHRDGTEVGLGAENMVPDGSNLIRDHIVATEDGNDELQFAGGDQALMVGGGIVAIKVLQIRAIPECLSLNDRETVGERDAPKFITAGKSIALDGPDSLGDFV